MLLSGRGALQQRTNPRGRIIAVTGSVPPQHGSTALQVRHSPVPAAPVLGRRCSLLSRSDASSNASSSYARNA